MRNVIRVGDATDHGGQVVGGASKFEVDGRAVARKGDSCICPIEGHQACLIAEGDPNFVVEGRPVAFDGHKTTCGATLCSSVRGFGIG
ncbi:PAAR domain-containing protein [Burkholderia paludis]|uniref:PAAR domain-containing protein n=1 Tax=Burkholderia paludis TaxID=1506587 RepID=UPI000946C56F|nr:PAAR domain-containing protein [Burkholderia paludis]